ncbi:MAG: universal stress protein, partial [Pseudomonadales bacterium]
MTRPKLDKIFCVIDPTTNNQRALKRAVSMAANSGAMVLAHLCFSPQPSSRVDVLKSYREAEQSRYQLWLDWLLKDYVTEGVKITSELTCDDDWRAELLAAAKRVGADIIIRSSFRRSALQRRVLKTTDWMLLRQAHCPVLLVKTDRVGPLEKVLVALNLEEKGKAHQQLTDTVIEHARSIVDRTGAELHAVNAYQGLDNFVHPPDLAKRVGVQRNKAHVGEGSPEDQIAATVTELGAPLVV